MYTDLTLSGTTILLIILGIVAFTIFSFLVYKIYLKKRGADLLSKTYHQRSPYDFISSRNKYREVDVLRNTRSIFGYSLAMTIVMVLFAFSYTQYDHQEEYAAIDLVFDEEEIEIMPRSSTPHPQVLPPPPKPEIIEIAIDDVIDEPIFVDTELDVETVVHEPITDYKEESSVVLSPPVLPINEEKEAPVFKVVQQMPRFPGCEDISGSNEEKKECADQKMLEYIYSRLSYPKIAVENGVEGMAVIRFIVNEDGSIVDAKLVKDPGAGTGDAALEVVQEMKNMPQKWTPGKQRGKNVRVLYTLPVKFKLEG